MNKILSQAIRKAVSDYTPNVNQDPKDKRLDFNIWYDQENLRILKVTYSRMGNWEYRLKNYE